ncbi:choline/ethanolamine transporter flvcr2a-like [Clavelina lepadiformis]|uniref:choline/ethanolamine transporter flvcr2a-like n=1 Tax=Clavelina lepadiformis TaxID=159417 RepID=UPI0040416C39
MDALNDGCVLTKYEESSVKLKENGHSEVVILNKNNDYGNVPPTTRLFKRRFLILGIFCLYSMSSAFQWIEYAIITNIVLKYYEGATELAIAWTSMIYMLSYIPLMFVATWMLDNWGLRRILLFGATLNAVGSLIKIGSVSPNLFFVSFLGQTISACAQSFILEIPPKIASLWFGPSEVSTATAIGVFGNQLGCALGFLIPPKLVPNSDNLDEIGAGFRVLFISSAVVCTGALLLMFIVIRDEPKTPPSIARALSVVAENKEKAENSPMKSYLRSIGVLMKNVPYLLLFLTYGINTGTYYAIGTLLNPIMLNYHEDAEQQIGEIGLTMVVAGLVGSVLCGYFLDKTKLYKTTTVGIYVLSMAFMFVFTFTLQLKILWLDYLSIGLLGFFMTGYLPIGFEFAAEITYPVSEATSSGLLNVSAQFFGILFTISAQELLKLGSLAANLFMAIALLVGTVLTALIRADLKRKAANETNRRVTGEEKMALADVKFMPANHNHNQNNNNSVNRVEGEELEGGGFGDEEKLVRLASASSCYSAGPDW